MRHALEEAHGGIYRYTSKADMDLTFDRACWKIDHPMTALEFWRLADCANPDDDNSASFLNGNPDI